MRRGIRANYQQKYLLPPSIEEWIGAEHPARFIREFVDGLDLAAMGFGKARSLEGGRYYTDELLIKVWVYGYFRKIRSSRRLEEGCSQDIGMIWLCGDQRPDHNTLWRFWQDNRKALRQVYTKTVQVALKLKLVGLVLQAVDGTKIQAVCSGRKVYDEKSLRRLLEAVEKEVGKVEKEIEEGQKDLVGAVLPQELSSQEELREKIKGALEQIEQEGRGHCHPQELEARRMESDGRNRFSYNAQVVVDSKAQVIVAAHVVSDETDHRQLVPMIQKAKEQTGATPPTLADGGYASSEQFAAATENQLEVMTPLPSSWQNTEDKPYHSSRFRHQAERDVVICPENREIPFQRVRIKNGSQVRVYRSAAICKDCPVRSLCTKDRHGRTIDIGPNHQALIDHRNKMTDPQKIDQLKKRGGMVEPVFAQIKENGRFRRWTVRGLSNVKTQWSLLCAAWNLQVIFRLWRSQINKINLRLPKIPSFLLHFFFRINNWGKISSTSLSLVFEF